ncbi:TetR family transcriptional regulator [Microbacterium sp. ZW T5_45]|uniref:TetR family transcriptional regulator n=1 Tax=Microbacterium sp. ZW T5_45 TaxID=3378080 RepID=UPI003851A8EE
MDGAQTVGIRARARAVLKDQLADAALDLFEERGFDETTVDEIAAAAGISPRTFYRYFGTKEDALFGDILPGPDELRVIVIELLAESPPWEALHQAMRRVAVRIEPSAGRWKRVFRVSHVSQTLGARNLEHQIQLAEALVPLLTERLLAPAEGVRRRDAPLQASALVHAALVCFNTAASHWARGSGPERLIAAVDVAFSALGSADSRSA